MYLLPRTKDMNRPECDLYPAEYERLQLEILREWFPMCDTPTIMRALISWSHAQHYVRPKVIF